MPDWPHVGSEYALALTAALPPTVMSWGYWENGRDSTPDVEQVIPPPLLLPLLEPLTPELLPLPPLLLLTPELLPLPLPELLLPGVLPEPLLLPVLLPLLVLLPLAPPSEPSVGPGRLDVPP